MSTQRQRLRVCLWSARRARVVIRERLPNLGFSGVAAITPALRQRLPTSCFSSVIGRPGILAFGPMLHRAWKGSPLTCS
jgi:hypothetical protein